MRLKTTANPRKRSEWNSANLETDSPINTREAMYRQL